MKIQNQTIAFNEISNKVLAIIILRKRRRKYLATELSCEVAPVSEKAMAPHSSTLAWKIPWMEGPGRL